jgi:hypothetical protein
MAGWKGEGAMKNKARQRRAYEKPTLEKLGKVEPALASSVGGIFN